MLGAGADGWELPKGSKEALPEELEVDGVDVDDDEKGSKDPELEDDEEEEEEDPKASYATVVRGALAVAG